MTATSTQDWERTPIWDAEFADRWEQLHQELTEPDEPVKRKSPAKSKAK